ncbi:hypothetical protein LGW64_04040, partial [Streptococcus mutans]|nr:hypothetical protein [Streptococcus mutans]
SVIKADVLKSTGLKPATVNVNGKNISLSGETTTSYWAKNGPGLSLLYRAAYTTSEAFSYRCAGAGIGSLGVG